MIGKNKGVSFMAYNNQYKRETYDRISILREKGDKEKLMRVAKENGYRSLNAFINSCIDKELAHLNENKEKEE